MKHHCPDSGVTRQCVHHSSINLSPVKVKIKEEHISQDRINSSSHIQFYVNVLWVFLEKKNLQDISLFIFNLL